MITGSTGARALACTIAATLTVGTVAACSEAADDAPVDDAAATSSSTTAGSTAAATSPTTSAPETTAEPTTTSSTPAPRPDLAPLPDNGSALAVAIEAAEAAVRDPALGIDERAAWGRRQQSLYRHLSFHPEWADEALDLDDPVLARAAGLNWEARVHLEALVDSEAPHDELPAWRVVDPRPADELLGYYKDGEARWDIDWPYLAAINLVETRMGRIEGISTAGAIGPMQFLPTTWAECCEGDPTDPADAIPGAARYLGIRGGPEHMAKAIWGYNNSDHYVAAVTAYATVMAEDERAYHGYHGWEIYFRSTAGLIRIPQGYEELEPVPATEWLARHPETLVSG